MKSKFIFFILFFFIFLPNAYSGQTINPFTGKLDLCVTVVEEDGSPSNNTCRPVEVTNGTLADDGDGRFSLQTGLSSDSFKTIDAPAGTDPVASSPSDTLTITEGPGIDITGNATSKTLSWTPDTTEFNDITFGDNTDNVITHTIDVSTGTDPVMTFTDAEFNVNTNFNMKRTDADGQIRGYGSAGVNYISMYHDDIDGYIDVPVAGDLYIRSFGGNIVVTTLIPTLDNTYNLGLDGILYWKDINLKGFIQYPTVITMDGEAERTFGSRREQTANTAGNNFVVKVGGASSGATNKDGGSLVLSGGTSTGDGESTIIFRQSNSGQGSGTTDRTTTDIAEINEGHLEFIDTAPTLSSCGTSPSISTTATDHGGTITIGTGALVTSCTLTFSTPAWTNAPACVAMNGTQLAVFGTSTTTALTLTTATSMDEDVIMYVCTGEK